MAAFAFIEPAAVAALRLHGNSAPPGAMREVDRMVTAAIEALSEQVGALNEANERAHATMADAFKALSQGTDEIKGTVGKIIITLGDHESNINTLHSSTAKLRCDVKDEITKLLETLKVQEGCRRQVASASSGGIWTQ